jgi:hypothetical protein
MGSFAMNLFSDEEFRNLSQHQVRPGVCHDMRYEPRLSGIFCVI